MHLQQLLYENIDLSSAMNAVDAPNDNARPLSDDTQPIGTVDSSSTVIDEPDDWIETIMPDTKVTRKRREASKSEGEWTLDLDSPFRQSQLASEQSTILQDSDSHPLTQASPIASDDEDLEHDPNIRNFAPVARIMRAALLETAKITQKAKECMQECLSEFISFVTSEAAEKCRQEKRDIVQGEDIRFAMYSLGFENYSEAPRIYIRQYRENMKVEKARGKHQ